MGQVLTVALLAKLVMAATGLHPAAQPIGGSTFDCVALTQQESHYHRAHVFACVDPFGTVLGALLRRNGTVLCRLDGTFTGTCLTLEFCGEHRNVC